ncbi:MAG: hypothetical protein AAF628_20425 [Planctomycetota bacterium]
MARTLRAALSLSLLAALAGPASSQIAADWLLSPSGQPPVAIPSDAGARFAIAHAQKGGACHIPYWYLDGATTSVLELSNPHAQPRMVRITAQVRGERDLDLGRVNLPMKQTIRIPLGPRLIAHGVSPAAGGGDAARWGTGERAGSLWGSLTLDGETNGLRGWVVVMSKAESLSTTPMMTSANAGSTGIVAQWWRPTADTDAFFAVMNIGERQALVLPSAYHAGMAAAGRGFVLRPRRSRLLTWEAMFGEKQLYTGQSSGFVRFDTARADAKLRAHTVLVDRRVGFSTTPTTQATASRRGYELQTPGVPFGAPAPDEGFPAGTRFSPELIASNVSNRPIEVAVYLQGTDSTTQQWREWLVLETELDASETIDVDLRHVAQKALVPVQDGHVGLRVVHTGTPSSLAANLAAVDQSLTFSVLDPLVDTTRRQVASQAVSFNLHGNNRARLVIKNTADTVVAATWALVYADPSGHSQDYVRIEKIGPQQLVVLDLENIRDRGIPDIDGKTLPSYVEYGYATVSRSPHLLASDPTYDIVAGTLDTCMVECTTFPEFISYEKEGEPRLVVTPTTQWWSQLYRKCDGECGPQNLSRRGPNPIPSSFPNGIRQRYDRTVNEQGTTINCSPVGGQRDTSTGCGVPV